MSQGLFTQRVAFHKHKPMLSTVRTRNTARVCQKRGKVTGVQCSLEIAPSERLQKNERESKVTLPDFSLKSENTVGLGIPEFLKNKNILVTGATGFLGKVLIEKILRVQPEVGRIYLLINADTPQAAKQRLEKDIKDSRLFARLQQIHGSRFDQLLQEKLVALPGKLERPDLGIDNKMRKHLVKNLDVVVNSAATTNFTERYDVALDINTKGPHNLLSLVKECFRVQLFLHISTAYVHGTRKHDVKESPFLYGQSIRKEEYDDDAPDLDVWKEIESVKQQNYPSDEMKNMGMQRAKLHGWQDTYVFTKAMGEMLINHGRENIPVVILRPSIIEGTHSEPVTGWIQGTRMMDPILLAYGKGHIHGFYADPDCALDVIPADMVVNTLLAAMSHHAGQSASMNVYQIGSSSVNPLTIGKLMLYTRKHFMVAPFLDKYGNAIHPRPFDYYTNKFSFALTKFLNFTLPSRIAELWGNNHLRKRGKQTMLVQKIFEQLVETYSSYTFYKARFDITNTRNLYELMSAEEKEQFPFSIWSVDWEDYLLNVHLPGLRKYNVRENSSNFQPITLSECFQQLFATAIHAKPKCSSIHKVK